MSSCKRSPMYCLGAFLLCGGATIAHEVYHATNGDECSLFVRDIRWVSRFIMFFGLPLTFAFTMDEVPALGEPSGLSFSANEVQPPIWFRMESMFPALLVGFSLPLLIGGFSWIYCAVVPGLFVGISGFVLMMAGFQFSLYLQKKKKKAEQEREREKYTHAIEAAPTNTQSSAADGAEPDSYNHHSAATIDRLASGDSYHPDDMVHPMANKISTAAAAAAAAAVVAKSKTLGTFDYNPKEENMAQEENTPAVSTRKNEEVSIHAKRQAVGRMRSQQRFKQIAN